MKKTYINPTLKVLTIQLQQMLAASIESGFTKSGAGTLNSDVSSGNMARDFDFDDEEY